MARRRASMREGPLAELFKATEAAQKQAEKRGETEADAPAVEDTVVAPTEPEERTVEHVPSWEEEAAPAEPEAAAPAPAPETRMPEPPRASRFEMPEAPP